MGYSVERVEIDFLEATTYRGTIKLTKAGSWGKKTKTKSIDARPSDAIAVALAANARIFITPGVAEKHLLSPAPPKDDDESFKQFLAEVKASDFKLSGTSSGEA
jgi:bifunctional DNase/RNase